MFSMSVWLSISGIIFLCIFIYGFVCSCLSVMFITSASDNDRRYSFLLGLFCLFLASIMVIVGGLFSYEGHYSDPHVDYGKIENIESISIENDDENSGKILEVSSTNKNGYLKTKNYPFDPEANTDINDSNFNISDGYATIRNSDKKVIEEATLTRTKHIDFHYYPLVKNEVEQETITYYIIYYPLDELDVNK